MPNTTIPQELTAAQAIALANRLLAFKASPGFHDLKLICESLENEALEGSRDYPGFDPQQITQLKIRHQVAHELVQEIFGRIEAAINQAKGCPGFIGDTGEQPQVSERIAGSY